MIERMQDPLLLGEASRIGPEDPRYDQLVLRGKFSRYRGRPDLFYLVGNTEQVVDAVQDAVRAKRRLAVRSGGHCLEGFVADPAVRAVIDTSLMTGVAYDSEMNAFRVEAGTTVGELYRRLFLGWGVTIPAGESPDIGVGGHIAGGASGYLCREHGLAADHLHAIEVVVVDPQGNARSVVATRAPDDPNRDLWWAHTGAGGGNFGVVTRCWFRSPGVAGSDPGGLLPKAPESVLVFRSSWNWEHVDQQAFTTLVRNYGEWSERNSLADVPSARLSSTMFLWRRALGRLEIKGLCTDHSSAEAIVDEHMKAITAGVSVPNSLETERLPWLSFALNPFPELFRPGMESPPFKGKDAFLRRRFTDRQMEAAYDYLTRTDYDVVGGMLGAVTYGGKVNTVSAAATASAQRDSILSTACAVGWGEPGQEATSLAWVRGLYRDLFADTGGVPTPGDQCDGCMINHPDTDLADPELNTSGVPWHRLYFKDNYRRLQQIK